MSGVDLIAAERTRQIEEEGWTPEHDAQHRGSALAWAAACYAAPVPIYRQERLAAGTSFLDPWPWRYGGQDKRNAAPTPDERLRELVKAGALIAAEIDRLSS